MLRVLAGEWTVGVFHCRKGKKHKILKWFEQTFALVSGEDQLLQLDEFKQALRIHGVSVTYMLDTSLRVFLTSV